MNTCTDNDNTPSPKQDIYARITGQIVAALETGVRPWVRPWNAEHAAGRITRPLRHNGQPYTGINVLSLWASATAQGFAAPIWMTYRQATELGAHVRKGEKGSPVVYANSITRTETDTDSGAEVERDIHFLKGYTVFNVEQIEGLPEQYTAPASPRTDTITRIAHAEEFFAAIGADVSYGGSRAFYRPSTDSIVMPPIEAFKDAESFYATLAHEHVHLYFARIAPRTRLRQQAFRLRRLRHGRTRRLTFLICRSTVCARRIRFVLTATTSRSGSGFWKRRGAKRSGLRSSRMSPPFTAHAGMARLEHG